MQDSKNTMHAIRRETNHGSNREVALHEKHFVASLEGLVVGVEDHRQREEKP
jgi:hypothetical protein